MYRHILRTAKPARALAALCLIFSLYLAGCSDSTTDPQKQVVTVTLREYSITMNPMTLKAGPTVFKVTNSGTEEHNFEVEEKATDAEKDFPAPLKPGETKELEVTLNKGGYEFYDPLGGNKLKGMLVELDVQ